MHQVLQVNTDDLAGGAEAVARALQDQLRRCGHRCHLAVGCRRTDDPEVLEFPTGAWPRACRRVREALVGGQPGSKVARLAGKLLQIAGRPGLGISYLRGREYFGYPATARLLSLPPYRPSLLVLHNLHGDYFDLRALPALSHAVPTVLVLHDAWLLAGHCIHSLDCGRWETGCGRCPYLNIPVRMARDQSAANWQRKRDLLRRCRLYVASPARWLIQRVERSILAPAIVASRVIPHGIDLEIFQPADRAAARRELGLPAEAVLGLFVANRFRLNPWKDFATLHAALALLGQARPDRPIHLLAIGQAGPVERLGPVTLYSLPFLAEPCRLVRYYQAADYYVHPAKADTYPTTIMEAMACGLPVVAHAVGGVCEMVEDRRTGLLTAPGDAATLARALQEACDDTAARQAWGAAALAHARAHFDARRFAGAYLEWFDQIAESALHEPRTRRS
jgi:glycosyltransferase involved in cell wall biosynthesis